MEEAGDLLEDSWFFGNLLIDTKTRTFSRCYSDLTSSSCPPPLPPLCSNQERIVKNQRKNSRKQPPVAPPCLTRTPSLPFLMKNTNSSSDLMPNFMVGSDQQDAIERKQPITRIPYLPNSMETQSFLPKTPNPNPNFTRTSSMSTSADESDQEDEEEEEDQEREFSLGRLIRQASMNSSHTSKAIVNENLPKKHELYQEKISDMRKMERNRSKNTRISGKKKNAPAIPGGGWVDKSSSDDHMKAHIKFWARAVASNVRQECS